VIDLVIRAAIAVGYVAVTATVAVVGYLVANETVKAVTNKDIPTHLYNWWSEVRERIVSWKTNNPRLRSARILAEVVIVGEKYVARLKKTAQMVNLNIFAVPENEIRRIAITTEELVPLEEAQRMFGATPGTLLDLTHLA
jgi:hypothetical protein